MTRNVRRAAIDDDLDVYVEVQPNADGSFDIVPFVRLLAPGGGREGSSHYPSGSHTWRPTRRELKALNRAGIDPFDEAERRARVYLERLRAQREQEADLRRQMRRLT
ncbi:MAG: hypothetical protein J0I40_06430 [Cellulomonas sp.]|uniref:hypothetical protein n=1 Tax=Cellulomonas sp. 73-92 TaxID=1895740 RepID=UPI00092C36AA|nr:hypothetical protein [Cellulomonas sp. 73-92]MBN9375016.1 hypothetical protein [Cellulomonas sp.]OJV76493.1 MAG: hypothetical protein BGO37_10570 [Cellulomonas sp. 73-92]